MESSSDKHGKGIVIASDVGISRVLKNGGNNVGELRAINLVVDLRQCFTKQANDVVFTKKYPPMDSVKPGKIIQCAQDLAKDPFGMSFLEVLTIGGHLSAYKHWKGYYQLHVNEILDGLDDKFDYGNPVEVTKSQKSNDLFDGGLIPTKKVKCLSDLMSKGSNMSHVEHKHKNRPKKRKFLEFNRDEFLSWIYMFAKNPIQKTQNLDSAVRFSSDFRNYRVDQTEKMKKKKKMKIQPEVSEEHGVIEDSYWADMIIEMKQRKENSPTALILKFTNLERVPSMTKMNEIFGRFGSLQEHESYVLKKKNCVKMVFKRRCDAETAFSSSGKFKIFGPNLVSYCLNFSPTPRKKRTAGGNQTKKVMKPVKRKLFED